MRRSAVFLDSFLDGFTMSGFLTGLRRPGAATHLFAPESEMPEAASDALDELRKMLKAQQLEIDALKESNHTLLIRLDKELKAMKSPGESAGKAEYGSSR